MKGNAEDAVREGAHALFYPHGLGHMMGLDVHDMESLGEQWVGYNGQPKSTQFGRKSQRLAIPLEPGFVHTVEPGIYSSPNSSTCGADRRSSRTSSTTTRWRNTVISEVFVTKRTTLLPPTVPVVWARRFP